ncbi:ABC transporter permease [Flavitalea sp.]|nr:ABC transporter permease [Flavitalea sp.]
MFKNYLKAGFRSLRKHKIFTIINIVGLSLSVAFCLLLYFHIRHEQSYDIFHEKKDRLYRLEMTEFWNHAGKEQKPHLLSFLTKDDDLKNQLNFPLVTAEDLKRNFPEVENVIPMKSEGPSFVQVNNKIFKEDNSLFVGQQFFQSLSFKMIYGDPQTVLNNKNNIVLSETLAAKYFGDANPIGQTITITDLDSAVFKVSGIVEDAPQNSSIKYSFILPLDAAANYEEYSKQRFNWLHHLMLVELKDNVNASIFETKMNKWVKSYFTEPFFSDKKTRMDGFDPQTLRWFLRPLAKAHYNVSSPWGHYTNAKNLYQLACLVIIILLLASINYILLTVANAASRSREVGVRKIMGADKRSVVFQFWIETQIIVLLSVTMGFCLAWLMLPFYNNLTGSSISLKNFSFGEVIVALVILSALLGFIAGYYPARVISALKPISIVKSSQTFKISPAFSRLMIIVQYSCCIVLMMAAYVITKQMNYIFNKDLGFDKEQILIVKNQGFDMEFTKKIRERFETWVTREPIIRQYTVMNGGMDGIGSTNGFMLNGEQKWLKQLSVDYDFFEMLDLKILKGRSFQRTMTSDTSSDISASVINETLFNMLGKNAKIGVYNEDIRSTIIGVVEDYHFESLAKKIEPRQHILTRRYARNFLFKVQAGQMQAAINKIKKEWATFSNNLPFEFTFLDDTIARMYEADKRWQKLVQGSCVFAIIIACMGLFGLSGINAANRTKEIGIRKILGANASNIAGKLALDFIGMIIISMLIAMPFGWWLMNGWLKDYEYRIEITGWMFVAVGLTATTIALITVAYQSMKAAIVNPIDSLRSPD